MAVTNHYETLLVLEASQTEEQKNAIIEKTKSIIESQGAIEKLELWGNRRLAYPIDFKTEGYYVVIQFTSEPELPKELERVYRITDGILRFLVIKRDERYLDVQVKLDIKGAAPKKEEVVEEEPAPVAGETTETPVIEEVVAEETIAEQEPVVEEVVVEEVIEATPQEVVVEEVVEIVEEAAPVAEEVEEETATPEAEETTEEVVEEKPKKAKKEKKDAE